MSPDELARLFHETYEGLAPQFGYKTRKRSRVSWEEVPDDNKALMVATAAVVLDRLRDERAQQSKKARDEIRAVGGICEGQARFGYRKENGKVTPNDDEQKAIALIRRRRREGATLRAICSELEARGIRPRRGQRWHPNQVRRVLSYGNRPVDRAG